MKAIMFTDGGSRGNPGPSAIGIVIKNTQNESIREIGKYIGEGTNNEAEYTALVEGLTMLNNMHFDEADCYLDSELVVKQLNGSYKVKNSRILVFWKKIKELEKSFKAVNYSHVTRDKNKTADLLVNEALDRI